MRDAARDDVVRTLLSSKLTQLDGRRSGRPSCGGGKSRGAISSPPAAAAQAELPPTAPLHATSAAPAFFV